MTNIDVQDITGQFNIAIVTSHFNEKITHPLFEGAIQRLKELEFTEEQITALWVPGAVELPLAAQRLAKTKKFEAIICLGAVIQGDTKHFDYVCGQASDGCQRVALDNDIPVIFGVLTTDDFEDAQARIGGEHGHKGRESADAAFEMVSVLRQI